MAKLNLDILKGSNKPDEKIFSDLRLDLVIGQLKRNEALPNKQNIDIESSDNLAAIRNSIISIITTSPGEKILNPTFGLNFGDLLFLPVSKVRAQNIGEIIVNGVEKFEPRITITSLNVTANISEQEYNIDIVYIVPRFPNQSLNLTGSINKSDFTFFN